MSMVTLHSNQSRFPRRLEQKARAVLVFSFLALWFSGTVQASPLSGMRVDFDIPPAWTISGAWGPGESLILIDALNSKIYRYAKDGTKLETLSGPNGGALAFPRPTIIYPLKQGGYLLEDQEAHLVRLDANSRPLAAVNLLGLAKNAKGEVGSVFNWALVDDGEVVTFSDIKQGDQWYSAFLRIPLGDPAGYEVLLRVDSEAAKRFYLLGNPYIAAVGGEAFFLVMDEQPYLARGGAGKPARRMAALSSSGVRRPSLPEQRGAGSAKAVFEILERARMPTGLYGWKEYLYLVMRQTLPRGGGLGWALVKVDPVQDRIVSTRPLDSAANHLTVVPGPQFWAFIEKGPVQGLGQQRIEGMLLIPTTEIEK